jgi:GT2 family glycosyltransferase
MDTIISLNWNTTDLMIRMFESALKTASRVFKLIIVDNGSTELEFNKLMTYFEDKQLTYREKNSFEDFVGNLFEYRNKDFDVTIKSLDKNVGFAAGNNVGLSLMKSCENVFFINSDIVVEENNWDLKFQSVLKDGVGIAGCAYHPLKWTREGRFQIQPLSDVPVESESVQGAFFSIPYSVLGKIHSVDGFYFDEKFKFAHYEETDLCFRVMKLGYKCMWLSVRHLHLHNNSATKKNGYKLSDEIKNIDDFKANSEKNRVLLFEKHSDFFEAKK